MYDCDNVRTDGRLDVGVVSVSSPPTPARRPSRWNQASASTPSSGGRATSDYATRWPRSRTSPAGGTRGLPTAMPTPEPAGITTAARCARSAGRGAASCGAAGRPALRMTPNATPACNSTSPSRFPPGRAPGPTSSPLSGWPAPLSSPGGPQDTGRLCGCHEDLGRGGESLAMRADFASRRRSRSPIAPIWPSESGLELSGDPVSDRNALRTPLRDAHLARRAGGLASAVGHLLYGGGAIAALDVGKSPFGVCRHPL
jgi:hypothetical protein